MSDYAAACPCGKKLVIPKRDELEAYAAEQVRQEREARERAEGALRTIAEGQPWRDAINLVHAEGNRAPDERTRQHWKDVAAILEGNLLAIKVVAQGALAAQIRS